MAKRILLTGATDGIGLATAKTLVSLGHHVMLHGRSNEKLERVKQALSAMSADATVESYVADLSDMSDVESFAKAVAHTHERLDVLINNAGVFVAANPVTSDGIDLRFAVNTIAPYLLTQRLLPLLGKSGRVINLSSAAQAPVEMDAFRGDRRLADGEAYAQSKLALTMWSRSLATTLGEHGPAIIAVNPGSFLGSKMVKEAYGAAGKDLNIGAEILTRAALDDDFASASGKYFDNDSGQFASPHPDAIDPIKTTNIVKAIEAFFAKL
ncbi:short chain dehydrogenase [Neorhodopirellula lusitana]|uniref:Short chain dehydrogenase n=1 Tax=Neorhodopirellula lusitana TaxID=445327 RepID=A0ABY1QCX8_9BACT|nr:SDR family NAD(P)-dependent oxidoreductase [Neorhodopirellula lusitana]SMP67603.1 short chain dehydrogenase [Neorhodopirellula lusitana]